MPAEIPPPTETTEQIDRTEVKPRSTEQTDQQAGHAD
jgi:hypothetical protein